MRFEPKRSRRAGRINIRLLPPDRFVAGAMDFAVVPADVLANEYLEFILQQAGYEVLSATSADEAAELLEDREDVQLIVTDINLPGSMNGLKLATAAKARRCIAAFVQYRLRLASVLQDRITGDRSRHSRLREAQRKSASSWCTAHLQVADRV
jgi:CheY-like chemotaxis protein